MSQTPTRHLGEFPARDVTFTKADGGQAQGRLVVGGGMMFNMMVIPRAGPVDPNRARNFFDALKIH